MKTARCVERDAVDGDKVDISRAWEDRATSSTSKCPRHQMRLLRVLRLRAPIFRNPRHQMRLLKDLLWLRVWEMSNSRSDQYGGLRNLAETQV